MAVRNLLYKNHYDINDKIRVMIPTVGQILENEEDYYSMVSVFTAMPIDYMVQLDDFGIDFSEMNEYELFLLLVNGIKKDSTSLILDGIDLSEFEFAVNESNKNVVLIDRKKDIVIDRAIHARIAATLRTIHRIEKDRRRPANEEAKKFMLERARTKMKRHKKEEASELESLIVAMVNTEQYKYDFERTRDLSIYQFNECVRQIVTKIDYEHRMHGVYAGTISLKDLSQDDLNWLTHK